MRLKLRTFLIVTVTVAVLIGLGVRYWGGSRKYAINAYIEVVDGTAVGRSSLRRHIRANSSDEL